MNEQVSSSGGDHWFHRGSEAMQARQWDYAVECFSNAVRLQPEYLHFRKAKHRSCRKRLKHQSAGATSSVRLVDIRRKLLQAKLQNDWKAVDRYAEEGLAWAASDAHFYSHVALAAVELQRNEIARYAWSMALRFDPQNCAFNKAFGRFLATQQEFDEAEKCFKRILQQQPEDRYAAEMLRYIDVERLIHDGRYRNRPQPHAASDEAPPSAFETTPHTAGFDPNTGKRSAAAQSAETARQARELLATGQPQQPDSAAMAARRKNDLHRMARFCAEQQDWPQCLSTYRELLKQSPQDAVLREEFEDALLSHLRCDLEKLQRAARKNPASQLLQQQADEQETRLLQQRVQFYRTRIERYPTDLNLRFVLAEDYSRLGLFTQAIPLYQQACQHVALREQALLKLGQCWICDGKRELASRQFVLALKNLSPQTHPEGWKTAHYWLGRIEENEGRIEAAIAHYEEVLLLDYDFRDTLRRLEEHRTTTAQLTPGR